MQAVINSALNNLSNFVDFHELDKISIYYIDIIYRYNKYYKKFKEIIKVLVWHTTLIRNRDRRAGRIMMTVTGPNLDQIKKSIL